LNGSFAFSGIENLTGGTGIDTFTFADGAGVTGTIDGGSDNDVFDYSAYTSNVGVDLQNSAATGIGAFAGIEDFVGGTVSDTLTGLDADASWNITGAGTGTVSAVAFAGFEHLIGGTGVDTFTFGIAGTVSGDIDGGAGLDTIVQTDGINSWTVSGADSGTVMDLGGTFANVENLTGGSGVDTFVISAGGSLSGNIDGGGDSDQLSNADGSNTWTLDGTDAGSVTDVGGTFVNIENLTGGSGSDSYNLADGAAVTGTIDGGGSSDTVSYGMYTTGVDINFTAGTATNTGTVTNLENMIGGQSHDTLTGDTGNNSMVGGPGNDTFVFADNWGEDIVFNTVAGNDTLDFSAVTTDLTVAVDVGVTDGINTVSVNTYDTIIGGSGTDELVGPNTDTIWDVAGADSGSVGNIGFSDFELLTGGSDIDTFNLATAKTFKGALDGGDHNDLFVFGDQAAVTGIVDGGPGPDDRLDYNAYTTIVNFNIPGGTATGTGGIANIETVVP
jgi:hypothetical protein